MRFFHNFINFVKITKIIKIYEKFQKMLKNENLLQSTKKKMPKIPNFEFQKNLKKY